MKLWLYRTLFSLNVKVLRKRIAEALQEAGVLWMVFAMLDKLVAGALTVDWIATQSTAAIVVWSIGTYIEATEQTES